jgi:hypothetical protein
MFLHSYFIYCQIWLNLLWMIPIQFYHNFSKENTVEPVLPNANCPIVNV